MFRLLFVIVVVYGKTVRYTNVPPTSRTTRTYEIEVPGKPPIRIIEADPLWSDNNIARFPYRENLEHRAVKLPPTNEPATTTLSATTLEENSTRIYSPEALNTFLKHYAEKIRERKKDHYSRNKTTPEPYESIDRLSEISVDEDENHHEKPKRWGLVDVKKHNHPFEDKNGWVTMDAIPWSASKISKWHTNYKYEEKPLDYEPYNHQSFNSPNQHSQDFQSNFNKPSFSNNNARPPFQNQPFSSSSRPTKPMYGYDSTPLSIKPRPEYNSEPSPRPGWDKPTSSYNIHISSRPESWYHEKPHPQVSINYDGYPIDEQRDIITDGKPGDFPSKVVPNRRPYEPLKERPSSSVHLPTHPANGNGEWVLLSTTKGYQYPKAKQQRSLDLTPNSVGTKRTVRLTVLPPDDNSKVNMTTSHGGLLEVESTFETVEQSQKQFSERMQLANSTKPVLKLKRRPKPQVKTGSLPLPVVQQNTLTTNSRTNNPDTSAVLAAIGAGMVPATMAMLMPLVNGRRRRSLQDSYIENVLNVTRVPFIDYELTLQRSY